MLASDPTFPLFPVFAFLGFVLSIVPLPWHFQAWNSGTCAFMIWVGSLCLVEFINALVWADNALNVAPVWCDISCQIILGAGVGIPASTLCISRRLYRITSTQTVSITRDDKRRAIYSDLAIAVGLPVLVLLLHLIVQPHRFDVVEQFGCTPATYNTLPAYFLFYMWPILIGVVSFGYSSMTLRSFYVRRIQFNQILSSNGALNPSRYLRLMLLALIDIMCTIPLGIYTIYLGLQGTTLAPWKSWADTHFDFGRVQLVPAVIWRSNPASNIAAEVRSWVPIVCAFAFFALFGFAEEAMKNYRRAFWFVAKPLGFRPSPQSGSVNKKSILSGLKNFKVGLSGSSDRDSLPVYANPKGPVTPLSRFNRASILAADARSTICFPDDGVELDPYVKKLSSFRSNSLDTPSSPTSSSSCGSPITPVTPKYAPPPYIDSAHLDAAALELAKRASHLPSPSTRSWISLPEMIVEEHEHPSRPSSYSFHADDDHISISDEYVDSRATSPVEVRTPTPMPFAASEVPSPPSLGPLRLDAVLPSEPPLAYHRPFSPPSVYPLARPHAGDRGTNVTDSIIVTGHSSRDEL